MEHRRNERLRFRAPVTVSAPALRPELHCDGNALTYSVYGMLVELPCEIPLGTNIEVYLPEQDLRAHATVRHSRRVAHWYRTGIQFDAPLLANRATTSSILLAKRE